MMLKLIMRLNIKYILASLLLSASLSVHATHISEPILNDTKTKYHLGEKIILNGWVSYDNKPTADVLLAFKVANPDGSIAIEESYPSDVNGEFIFKFPTNNLAPGAYLVTVTSHCQAIHRSICTYKNKTLSIEIVD